MTRHHTKTKDASLSYYLAIAEERKDGFVFPKGFLSAEWKRQQLRPEFKLTVSISWGYNRYIKYAFIICWMSKISFQPYECFLRTNELVLSRGKSSGRLPFQMFNFNELIHLLFMLQVHNPASLSFKISSHSLVFQTRNSSRAFIVLQFNLIRF